MHYLNSAANMLADQLFLALPRQNPRVVLLLAALPATVVLLLSMRLAMRPVAVERAKKKLIARIMELHLFRHDPVTSFGACGRILTANAAYLGQMLLPMLLTSVPGLLILIQLNCWFSHRPLRAGETAVIEVQFAEGVSLLTSGLSASTSDILTLDTPALRIPSLRQVNWRIHSKRDGQGWLEITTHGKTIRKQIVVSDQLTKISERRVRSSLWQSLLYPAEPPIESDSPVDWIAVRYPPRRLYFGLKEVPWLAAFLGATLLYGALLKRPLKLKF